MKGPAEQRMSRWSMLPVIGEAVYFLPQIHRRDMAAAFRRGMRGQGTGWRGPDAAEMGDAECGSHAKGMLTARGSDAGSDFQRRPEAEGVRGPA